MAVRDELIALAKLAQMDESARDLDAELQQIPASLEELRANVQMLETLLAQERAQIEEAQALKVTKAAELKERTEGLSRARRKVAQSTNMKESQASEREVEANRRAIKEREEDLRRIGEAMEAKTASLVEREKDFEEAKQLLQGREETAKTRLAELSVERDKLLGGRDEIVSKVPKAVIRQYDRLKGPLVTAVAIIADGTCPACRISLPPQLYNEIRRGDDFHRCPQCRRLIIFKEYAAEA